MVMNGHESARSSKSHHSDDAEQLCMFMFMI